MKLSAEYTGKRGPLTQPRRSTTTTKLISNTAAAIKQSKKVLGAKSQSLATGPSTTGIRKTSQKKLSSMRARDFPNLEDEKLSNKSGGTHILDEVLHQSKTEAYGELQRKCETVLG